MLRVITILILILSSTLLHSQNGWTVFAKSGLILRSGPGTNYSKIKTLPFGTKMVVLDLNGGKMGYKWRLFRYTDEIDGRRGVWMKVLVNDATGYVFSGYCLEGDWFLPSGDGDLNSEFRVFRPGKFCHNVNYDHNLHWYSLSKNGESLEVKKGDIQFTLIHEESKFDTLWEFWKEYPLKISDNNSDTTFLLIGSSYRLEQTTIYSEFLGEYWTFPSRGKFLYPEEVLKKTYASNHYYFRAFDQVILTEKDPKGYKTEYRLELEILGRDFKSKLDISEALNLWQRESGKKHAMGKTPQILWIGDINNDEILDFIIHFEDMVDSCAACTRYYLFMSDILNSKNPIKLVANFYECSCHP